MSWNYYKSKVNEKSYSTRMFFRGLYLDCLRIIFSRYFVRNRRFFLAMTLTPFCFYTFLNEKAQIDQIFSNRSLKKDYVGEKLLYERGLADMDDETYAHFSNYMKKHHPR